MASSALLSRGGAKAVRTKASRGDSGAIGAAVSGVVGVAASLAIVVVGAAASLAIVVVGVAASLAIVVVGAAVSQVAAHVFRHCATPPEGAPARGRGTWLVLGVEVGAELGAGLG